MHSPVTGGKRSDDVNTAGGPAAEADGGGGGGRGPIGKRGTGANTPSGGARDKAGGAIAPAAGGGRYIWPRGVGDENGIGGGGDKGKAIGGGGGSSGGGPRRINLGPGTSRMIRVWGIRSPWCDAPNASSPVVS